MNWEQELREDEEDAIAMIRAQAQEDDRTRRAWSWGTHFDDARAIRDLLAEPTTWLAIAPAVELLGTERAAAIYGCERCRLRSGSTI